MKIPYKNRSIRTSLGIMAILVLIWVSISSAIAQQLSDEAQSLAKTWLLKNCDVGEEGQIENKLKKWGTQLEPAFLEAVDKGPDSTLLSELQQVLSQRFEQRQKLLKTGEGLGLSKEDLGAAQNVTLEQFITQEREDFILRYKSQALLGLGIVGGEKAKEILHKIASDEKSPLKRSAEQAIKKLPPNK